MRIDRNNSGRFFPWPDEPEGSEKGVVLRLINGEAMHVIDRETVQYEYKNVGGQLFRWPIVDEEKRELMRLDYCIVRWKGLVDENGVEIECTPENKSLVVQKNIHLAKFIVRCLDELNSEVQAFVNVVRGASSGDNGNAQQVIGRSLDGAKGSGVA